MSGLRGMSIAWGMRLWSWVAASRTGDQSVQKTNSLGKKRDSGYTGKLAGSVPSCLRVMYGFRVMQQNLPGQLLFPWRSNSKLLHLFSITVLLRKVKSLKFAVVLKGPMLQGSFWQEAWVVSAKPCYMCDRVSQ